MINYSIIIPHYDVPELLGRCLRSIPEREDVQVIVVDDNSPGSENYHMSIPELKRRNVEFHLTHDGLGAGHARNVGLTHAVGKWLLFSDSDDFFVESFLDILDKYRDRTEDVIYFRTKSCDCYNVDLVIDERRALFDMYSRSGDNRYFRVCCPEPWGKLVRREFVMENGISFQETMAHNDLLFSMKVGTLAREIAAVDEHLYWYTYREGSLGHQKGIEPLAKKKDRVRAWYQTQLFLDSQGIKTSIYLPMIPCLTVFRHEMRRYFQLLTFMREEGIDYSRVFFETIKYCVVRVLTGKIGLKYQDIFLI